MPSRRLLVALMCGRIGRRSLCGFSRFGSGTIDVGDRRAAADDPLRDAGDHLPRILPLSFDVSLPRHPVLPLRRIARLVALRQRGAQLMAAAPAPGGISSSFDAG